MCDIIRRDRAFTEYMASWHGAVVSLPDTIGFEPAAPLMCARGESIGIIAIDSHEVGLKLASGVPAHLQPDLVLKLDDRETIQKIFDFTDGTCLKATIVCTSDDAANDWVTQRLQPSGLLDVAGFPKHGLKFEPLNLMLREIFVKGTVHGSMDETRDMMNL
ncbi:alcohol dehydrogenase 5 [Fusarium subglutinans]|uniref:Alcohol dehydrogenase 5 n=1 Tax=Gibberella subglutinans TaxID=42677 RepID=A0A8H5Q4C5_GIBSU|nr:alcohol dehydrogenase 5 [Fusarium subglutinans]KAF5607933.1 alcohol dehydrogenase 5 [Fusarium subglutinans]